MVPSMGRPPVVSSINHATPHHLWFITATKLVEFEGQIMTAEQLRRIIVGRSARSSALPSGAKHSSGDQQNPSPSLRLPPGPWGSRVMVYAPRSSQEGGTESPFHHWKDALQLAAHELGARPASDKPPGVHVVTSAGKEYFQTVLPSFQPNHQLEGVEEMRAKDAIRAAVKTRMAGIHDS
jgi:hypothetical protein